MNKLSTKDIFFRLLRARRPVPAPAAAAPGETVASAGHVASANMNLAAYGFTMDDALLNACRAASLPAFLAWYTAMDTAAKELLGDPIAEPIWPHFPDSVMAASKADLYIANVLHYLTHRAWRPDFSPARDLPALLSFSLLTPIRCGEDGETELIRLAVDTYLQPAPLSAQQEEDLLAGATCELSVLEQVDPAQITQRETLAFYNARINALGELDNAPLFARLRLEYPADVLRMAACMSGGDRSLATPTRFRSFTRSERRRMLGALDLMDRLPENMVRQRETWKRLGERLHPGEYAGRFPNAAAAFALLRGKRPVRTFEGVYQFFLDRGEYVRAAECAAARPGFLVRNLDALLRRCDEPSARAVLDLLRGVAPGVETRVLVQACNHFRNRSNTLRLATARRSGAVTHMTSVALPVIPNHTLQEVCDILIGAIAVKVNLKLHGGIYLDPAADHIVLPTTLRHTSRMLMTMAPGSRIAVEECTILRLFLFWWNEKDTRWDYDTDLDLSVGLFRSRADTDIEMVAYFNPKLDDNSAMHSGDVRSSDPDGGCEYVDLDVAKCRAAGFRYALVTVNSYSNEPFGSLNECFCGWMCRDDMTGRLFEPRTVKNRFDLSGESRQRVLLMIDLQNFTATMADMTVSDRDFSSFARDADANQNVLCYLCEDHSLTLREILDAAAKLDARAVADGMADADVVIGEPGRDDKVKEGAQIVSPYDIAGLAALFLG